MSGGGGGGAFLPFPAKGNFFSFSLRPFFSAGIYCSVLLTTNDHLDTSSIFLHAPFDPTSSLLSVTVASDLYYPVYPRYLWLLQTSKRLSRYDYRPLRSQTE